MCAVTIKNICSTIPKLLLVLIVSVMVRPTPCSSQSNTISFYVLDSESTEPIAKAHIFLANSTYGTLSAPDGKVVITIPESLQGNLIISHIGYDIVSVSSDDVDSTIYLVPTPIPLTEVTVTAQSKKVRKKDFKRFIQNFIGTGPGAGSCKINNPEVLQFQFKGDTMIVTAEDYLDISNEYLGYNIKYFLNRFVLTKDGSSSYLGKALFSPYVEDKQYIQRRKKTYALSLRHFLESMINHPDDHQYKIQIAKIENGDLQKMQKLTGDDILKKDSLTDLYLLIFHEFLMVTHPKLTRTYEINNNTMISSEEKSKFGEGASSNSSKNVDIPSLLYKNVPILYVDRYGHILNSEHVLEYGHWAEQRIAQMLPYDYNIP